MIIEGMYQDAIKLTAFDNLDGLIWQGTTSVCIDKQQAVKLVEFLQEWINEEVVTQMTPYAYEVTTNRGRKYLVYANSTEYDNAVMFGYHVKPLYQEVV